MNDQDLLLIERYYSHELDPADRLAFEQRLADDADFRAAALLHARSLEAIRLRGRDALKQELRQRPVVKPRPAAWLRFWQVGLMVLLALVAGWWWYKSEKKLPAVPANEPVILPDDSMEKEPEILRDPDTAGRQSPQQQAPSSDQAGTSRPVNTANLFAEAFSSYHDASLDPTVRAPGDSLTQVDRYLEFYRDKKYPETLEAFKRLSDREKTYDKLLFVKANALLATDQADEAETLLEAILKRNRSAYVAEAQWYSALAALKKGDIAGTKTLLRPILSNARAPHYVDAKKLMLKLQ